ncbi:MAG: YggS family pyridoxal phosphate-dependent enzyme [Aggregatilineales bacterium]
MTAADHADTSTPTLSVADRVAVVRARIAEACARASRPVESVTLVAVSKTHPPELVLAAVAAGIRHFGENRIEEADKIAAVRAAVPEIDLTWHMIGHVQSRKARDVITHFCWIHSLDSVKLAERYARIAQESGVILNVLLEMNVSAEMSKDGFPADRWQHDTEQRSALWNAVRTIARLSGLRVHGLMTIAPIGPNVEAARPTFSGLRILHDALAADIPQAEWGTLSMGMTDDYPVAIEEGATLIRVGRAIFGERAH